MTYKSDARVFAIESRLFHEKQKHILTDEELNIFALKTMNDYLENRRVWLVFDNNSTAHRKIFLTVFKETYVKRMKKRRIISAERFNLHLNNHIMVTDIILNSNLTLTGDTIICGIKEDPFCQSQLISNQKYNDVVQYLLNDSKNKAKNKDKTNSKSDQKAALDKPIPINARLYIDTLSSKDKSGEYSKIYKFVAATLVITWQNDLLIYGSVRYDAVFDYMKFTDILQVFNIHKNELIWNQVL